MKKKDETDASEADLLSRAKAVIDRPYSLGDDALLLEAAQNLARIAARLLERRHEDDEAALRHASLLVLHAEEIVSPRSTRRR
jgi:hypothetical protein